MNTPPVTPPPGRRPIYAVDSERGGGDEAHRQRDRCPIGDFRRHYPQEPHLHLGVIGVDPKVQGASIGSRLMQTVLARFDSEAAPPYLKISNPRSVPLY